LTSAPSAICSWPRAEASQEPLRRPGLALNQLIGLSCGIKDKVLGVHTQMVATRDITNKAKRARKESEVEA
jgi:hypothetical protein